MTFKYLHTLIHAHNKLGLMKGEHMMIGELKKSYYSPFQFQCLKPKKLSEEFQVVNEPFLQR